MKTYRRRFGVVAYQNTTNTTESLLEWWKDLGADVKKIEVFETDIGLKITIIFNADYDISLYFLDGGNTYYHPDMCLRFKTLEEAELEAMNIINQETYVNIPGNVNKVFIEIMVVDEEKEQEYADSIFVDTMFNKAKEEAHKDYEEMKNEKLKKQAKIIKLFRGH